MISSNEIKISQHKLLHIKKVLIVYRPVEGIGVAGHIYETEYPIFKLYGTKHNSTDVKALMSVPLKDYGKAGFISGTTDFRETVIPPILSSGYITAVAKDVSFEDYDLVYYTLTPKTGTIILLKDIIAVKFLISTGKNL